MGYRLSRIYTRSGDDGTTGLGDGKRVDKDDARVEAFGSVDELNSVVGLLLIEELPDTLRTALVNIQHTLFDLGGELSIPGHRIVCGDDVDAVERLIDTLNAPLAPLKEFILPGGTRAAALSHLARAVCRRAERRATTLARAGEVSPDTLRYLNRLSDLFFVMARSINREKGVEDVMWKRKEERDGT
jgi:cob(I)alamin adenosyltransferase